MASVPLVMIGPPVSPVPLATLVTVPVPEAVAQAQAVPFHSNTWPLAQVFSRLRVGVPLVAPPLRPEPVAVVIPVMVPAPGNFCPVANVNCPVLAIFKPVSAGVAVPHPHNTLNVAEGLA